MIVPPPVTLERTNEQAKNATKKDDGKLYCTSILYMINCSVGQETNF